MRVQPFCSHSEIPEHMASLTALKTLRLHGNTQIEGSLPLELIQIGRLEVLSMHFEANVESGAA